MVTAPNARGKFINTQMANLAGGVTPDTHFPVLAGNPRMDTRRPVLAGGVTDNHNAVLSGGIADVVYRETETRNSVPSSSSGGRVPRTSYSIPLFPASVTVLTQTREPPPEPQSGILVIFMPSLQFPSVSSNSSIFWTIRRNGFQIRTGSYNVGSTTNIVYPFVAYAVDGDPQPTNNTYTLELSVVSATIEVNVLRGIMGTAIVDFLNDTHSASLEGDEGIDTHSVILRGQSIPTVQAELIGEPGNDTHNAILLGNPPSAVSYRDFQTMPITHDSSGTVNYRFQFRNNVPGEIETTINVSNGAERVLVLATFDTGARRSDDLYSITVRRLNGPILGTFDLPAPQGVARLEPLKLILVDAAPIQGTNTYRLEAINKNPDRAQNVIFVCYSLIALDMPDINDGHFAELVGENEDTHNAVTEGSIIEDTHHGDLGGMGPVDTHNAEVLGSVRGKSPIGGRL